MRPVLDKKNRVSEGNTHKERHGERDRHTERKRERERKKERKKERTRKKKDRRRVIVDASFFEHFISLQTTRKSRLESRATTRFPRNFVVDVFLFVSPPPGGEVETRVRMVEKKESGPPRAERT